MIYYEALGRGEPLLIVHGGPGASHDYFLPYLLPLARNNLLIFIDERGSGGSRKIEKASDYSVENFEFEYYKIEVTLSIISLGIAFL